MKKTVKRIASAALGTALAVSGPSAAFASEEAATVVYGTAVSFAITSQGETLSLDTIAAYSEDGNISFSYSLTIPASVVGTEEPASYSLDDVLRICGSDMYINVDALTGLYQEISGDDSLASLLPAFGITESWLSIQIPADETNGSDASADTEFVTDLTAALTESFSAMEATTTESGVQIAINNDAILSLVQGVDSVLTAHGVDLGSMASGNAEDMLAEYDFTALFSDYIQAAAEGINEADPSISVEDGVNMIYELIGAAFTQAEASVTEELETASPDAAPSETASLTDQVSALLEAVPVTGTLSIDTVDSASSILLDVQAETDDDTIGLQVGIASFTEGEFAAVTVPESSTQLRDVVKTLAYTYFSTMETETDAAE